MTNKCVCFTVTQTRENKNIKKQADMILPYLGLGDTIAVSLMPTMLPH